MLRLIAFALFAMLAVLFTGCASVPAEPEAEAAEAQYMTMCGTQGCAPMLAIDEMVALACAAEGGCAAITRARFEHEMLKAIEAAIEEASKQCKRPLNS
jgi:hypothetical protein